MKKLLILMSALMVVLASSCESGFGGYESGEKALVSYNVKMPKIATRAYSDGMSANVLQYAVYNAAGNELTGLTVTNGEIHGSTTVNFELVVGQTYSVIFWAAADGAPYAVNFADKTMTVDYTDAKCNAEGYDAFYKHVEFTVTGAMSMDVELRRPFAQLNIGTSDYVAAANAGYAPTKSWVKVPVYTTLNLQDGSVSGQAVQEFALAEINKNETFPVAGYDYLAMNYLLVSADKEVVDVEFAHTATDEVAAVSRVVGSVPVQRNHRTNIYGKLFTTSVDMNVVIVPAYDDEDYNKEITDAVEVAPGVLYDEANATYMLTNKQGLEWLRDEVNNDNTFEGKIVTLTDDIDAGVEYDENGERISFATIGTCSKIVVKPFKGTFDGAGYTVKNIYQNGWDFGYEMYKWGSLGLFGKLENATVKNVTLDGFELRVEGGNVGGIAGNAAGDCVFENITVKNSILCSYNNGVAGILGWPEAGNYLFKDIKIESDVTIVAFWDTYDASLAGVLAEAYTDGTYHFENIEVSCKLSAHNDVTANSAYKWYNYRLSGMVVGNVGATTKTDTGRTIPDPTACNITCNNVVVNYGDWMNYHYCWNTALTRNCQRVEADYSYSGVDITQYAPDSDRDDDGDIDEDDFYFCLPFDQLFGGDKGVSGLATYEGVTVNYPASYNPGN